MKKTLIPALLLVLSLTANAQDQHDKSPEQKFDNIMEKYFSPDKPGGVAYVSMGDEILYRKAAGMADLELKVSMEPDMIFEIGSISKQFTAVAILQLEEEGKLSIKDDFRKYIPEFPEKKHVVTIEDLLRHTSGIRNYTNMQEFNPETFTQSAQPAEVRHIFENEELVFQPGSRWSYSNSNYILLGEIIEKISGMSYSEYVEEKIFAPAGMDHSYYASWQEIIPGRVSGYQPDRNGYRNAQYLDFSWPYAAGSLMMNVDDLAKWKKALVTEKLISKESLEKAFSRAKDEKGREIYYGLGWFIGDFLESRSFEHGGGIFGFVTNMIYLPDQDVLVTVFTNFEGSPTARNVSEEMAALAVGKDYHPEPVELKKKELEDLTGMYMTADSNKLFVIMDEGELYSQTPGGMRNKIIPYADDKFYFENSMERMEFSLDKKGKPEEVSIYKRLEAPSHYEYVNKEQPALKAIKMSAEQMSRFTGDYELSPGFILSISLDGDELMAQATGQRAFQIFPEASNKFFVRVIDAKIEFVEGEDGSIDHLVLYQGGQEIEGKKVE